MALTVIILGTSDFWRVSSGAPGGFGQSVEALRYE